MKRTASAAQQPPARGPNKRRRAVDDDADRYHEDDVDSDMEQESNNTLEHDKENDPQPHTPKRSRIAPEILPLGLERSDYHTLHGASKPQHNSTNNPEPQGTDVVLEADGELWSTEEDRILVELVLEKLKLTKSDWQDCARSLGKDRNSVGRRWKSLLVNGDVGLKRGVRARGRIHGTWR